LKPKIFLADEPFCKLNDWAKPGAYALIQVSDTGTGIPEQDLQRVFEPFFTTKGIGKGTGLGLSVVFGIIEQHKGHIEVYSKRGIGTTFKFFLPTSAQKEPLAEPADAARMVGGEETILFAEDDPDVLELVVGSMEEVGYTVLTAPDGIEACKVFDGHADTIDLVLLDVVMPKMRGKAVYEHIRKTKPALPVLFSTGYTAQGFDGGFLTENNLKLLQKPYTFATLFRAIRNALDGV